MNLAEPFYQLLNSNSKYSFLLRNHDIEQEWKLHETGNENFHNMKYLINYLDKVAIQKDRKSVREIMEKFRDIVICLDTKCVRNIYK